MLTTTFLAGTFCLGDCLSGAVRGQGVAVNPSDERWFDVLSRFGDGWIRRSDSLYRLTLRD